MTCDHVGHRVYAIKIFSNLTEHYCVQCTKCLAIVHQDGRAWIKREEIPAGKSIRPFIETDASGEAV